MSPPATEAQETSPNVLRSHSGVDGLRASLPTAPTTEVLAARRALGGRSPADPESEHVLIQRYQAGDRHAGEMLLRAHADWIDRVVRGFLRRRKRSDLPREDLIAEAQIGFLIAVQRFDPDVCSVLLPYALHWIRRNMRRATAAQGFTIRTPLGPRKNTAHVRRMQDLERLDAPLSAESDVPLLAMLPNQQAGAEEALAEIDDQRALRRVLNERLTLLPERERILVERRFLTEEPVTLAAVGLDLGISRERARQLEERVLAKIRRAFTRHVGHAA